MPTLDTDRKYPQPAYDDEEDYPMPHRYADAHTSGNDREISLGTGTILAIFFALAIVCSVFFGMGYTVGRKSTPPVTIASTEAPARSLSEAFKGFKPSPATPGPAAAVKNVPAADSETPASSSPTTVVIPTNTPSATQTVKSVAAATRKPFDPDAEIVTSVDPASKSILHTPTPAITPASAVTPGTAIVQVAAVSHQEDADVLLAALKRKGYTVAIHHEPQDKLLHLQLGPYPSKKDAEAMRLRLQSDGFNSILK